MYLYCPVSGQVCVCQVLLVGAVVSVILLLTLDLRLPKIQEFNQNQLLLKVKNEKKHELGDILVKLSILGQDNICIEWTVILNGHIKPRNFCHKEPFNLIKS